MGNALSRNHTLHLNFLSRPLIVEKRRGFGAGFHPAIWPFLASLIWSELSERKRSDAPFFMEFPFGSLLSLFNSRGATRCFVQDVALSDEVKRKLVGERETRTEKGDDDREILQLLLLLLFLCNLFSRPKNALWKGKSNSRMGKRICTGWHNWMLHRELYIVVYTLHFPV